MAVAGMLASYTAFAHTFPYFGWYRCEREIEVGGDRVTVSHLCRATFQPGQLPDPLVDSDGDTTVSERELVDLHARTARYLAQDFFALAEGRPLPSSLDSFTVTEGGTAFQTRIVSPLPEGKRSTINFLDPAYLMPLGSATGGSSTRVTASAAHVRLLTGTGEATSSLALPSGFQTSFTLERIAPAPNDEGGEHAP